MASPTLERKTNLKKGLNAEELKKSLKNDKFFAGIFDVEDLNKIIVNKLLFSICLT